MAEAASRRTPSAWLTLHPRLPDRPRMPRPKPSAFTGSADVDAMVERVAPSILALLADGVPRRKPAIVEALAGRHAGEDVALALVRLAVTDRVRETGGKYALAADPAPDAG